MESCEGMIIIWLSTVVHIGRVGFSKEMRAMPINRVVQSFRSPCRCMDSFSIWSRKLISSMTKQFRPATIFRIPTCWTDQLAPISNLAPSHARHHDRPTRIRRSRLSACRHGIHSFPPAWLEPCPRRRRKSRSPRQQYSHCRATQGSQLLARPPQRRSSRPYRRKEELVQEKILPRAAYEGIRHELVAK
jgi:hypothetical protein